MTLLKVAQISEYCGYSWSENDAPHYSPPYAPSQFVKLLSWQTHLISELIVQCFACLHGITIISSAGTKAHLLALHFSHPILNKVWQQYLHP
jgi:hypothetical protein